jgi:hypothetical protein
MAMFELPSMELELLDFSSESNQLHDANRNMTPTNRIVVFIVVVFF